MTHPTTLLGAALLLAATTTTAHAAVSCIEVAQFTVNQDGVDSKEAARAAAIPEHRLMQTQHHLAAQLGKLYKSAQVIKSGEGACPTTEGSYKVSGQITDFKKGNKALRYLVGFGAGAQKLEVVAVLTDAAGKEIAKQQIADRKVGGFLGGSDEKGVKDFAEKIVAFVKKAVAP